MPTLADLRAEIRTHYLPDEQRALDALVASADLARDPFSTHVPFLKVRHCH